MIAIMEMRISVMAIFYLRGGENIENKKKLMIEELEARKKYHGKAL